MTFRVSADEYDQLSRCCVDSGARSVAEFARTAVLHNVLATRRPTGTLSGDLESVSQALSELDVSLTDVVKKIRVVLGSVHSDQDTARQA